VSFIYWISDDDEKIACIVLTLALLVGHHRVMCWL